MSPHIIFVEEKFDDSGHCEAGRCLNGMHPGGHKDDWFVGSESDYFLITKGESFSDFKSIFALMRGDNNKIQYSSLIGFIQEILPKKDLLIFLKLLIESTEVLPAFIMSIGVSKSKLYTFYHLVKHEIELEN